MYSVMIVDDEKAIRSNLPHALDFRKHGFQVAAVAKNGKDALDQLMQSPVDLLFLDVCMPVLDGIGLLRELDGWEEDSRPLVVMLSGYGDFEYARAAIRYGVKGYLLKPVDEEEAEDLLEKLKAELDDRSRKKAGADIGEKVRLLRKLYHSADIGREPFRGNVLLHAVALSGAPESGGVQALRELTERQIPCGAKALFSSAGGRATYLFPLASLGASQHNVTLFGRHLARLAEQEGIPCVFLFDEAVFRSPKHAFRVDYETHLYAMESEIFWGTDVVLSADSPLPHLKPSSESRLEEEERLLSALCQALKDTDKEKLHAVFGELTDLAAEHRLHIMLLQELNYRIFYALAGLLPKEEQGGARLHPLDFRDAPVFPRFARWREELWEQLTAALETLEEAGHKWKSDLAGQAAAYVRAHFREPITLKSIADKCFVSPAHLGRCFQRAMGVSLKQYLTDLRIEEAKSLLVQTDLRVYEIAERVGFGESKHFVSRFTVCCGCTPAEYRKGKTEGEKQAL